MLINLPSPLNYFVSHLCAKCPPNLKIYKKKKLSLTQKDIKGKQLTYKYALPCM